VTRLVCLSQRGATITRTPITSIELSISRGEASQLARTTKHPSSFFRCDLINQHLRPYMNQAESQLYKHPKLVDELTKFRPSDVDGMSHSGLRQLSGKPGAFYQALAVVRDTNEPEEEPQVRPARLPQPPVREGFVSGDGLQLSSSPLADTTSSPPEIPPSSPYVPPSPSETSHATYEARRKPEIATATLAFEFLSSVLSLTGPVNEATQLEFVNTPATFVSKLGASECVSINDGSLLQRGLVGTRWTTIARTVHCSVEAKAWLECNAADEVGTSRQVLAQQVGEMMGMISQRIAEEVEMTEFERTCVNQTL
jgi:hypothetical protein